jgi:hypothetical protein
MVGAQLLMV